MKRDLKNPLGDSSFDPPKKKKQKKEDMTPAQIAAMNKRMKEGFIPFKPSSGGTIKSSGQKKGFLGSKLM